MDVLIVGGGGAGLRAAIAAAEARPKLTIGVISKVYPMRSHTVSAEGGAAAVIKTGDSLDNHAYDTISGADWLCDQDAVEAFVNEAPNELLQLEHWGCPLEPGAGGLRGRPPVRGNEDAAYVVRCRQDRLPHAPCVVPDHTEIRNNPEIRRMVRDEAPRRRWAVSGRRGDRAGHGEDSGHYCEGRHPLHWRLRQDLLFHDQCQHQERRRHGPGVPRWRAIEGHGIRPISPHGAACHRNPHHRGNPCRRGWLLNKDGYRYLQDYDLGKPEPTPVLRAMELGPRDRLSQAFIKEQEKGRTLDGPYGPYVHLDIRHVGESQIDKELPFVRELCLKYANLDPVKVMIPVRPVVHYMMEAFTPTSMARLRCRGSMLPARSPA